MSKKLVSILIPSHNTEKWLAETLKSALAQTYPHKEIIVVDDGSTDQSLAIAKEFESRGIRVTSQPNRGASAARNAAYRASNGDYIQYLDGDDLLSPDKIERQVALLEEYPRSIAAGEWGRFYQSETETMFLAEAVWKDMSPVEWLVCSWNGGGMMPIHAWLVPRSIAEIAGEWNENLSLNDDGEHFSRVILASEGVKFCSGANSYYRSKLDKSLSQDKSILAITSAFKSTELCVQHLLAAEDSEQTRQSCAIAFQRFVYSTYPNTIDLVTQAEKKIEELGGANLPFESGLCLQWIVGLFGWKIAKQIQHFYYT